jgi:hypothetical protein
MQVAPVSRVLDTQAEINVSALKRNRTSLQVLTYFFMKYCKCNAKFKIKLTSYMCGLEDVLKITRNKRWEKPLESIE